MESMPLEKKKDNLGMGLLLLMPVLVIAVVYIVIPLFRVFYWSFTRYNFIEKPSFVGLDNYRRLLSDDVFKIVLNNTVFALFTSSVIVVGLGYLFAWTSSHFPKGLRYALAVIFLCLSFTFIISIGIERIFAGDIYGYLNTYFIEQGKLSSVKHFLQDPGFLKVFLILITTVLGIGPSYLLFTIYFLHKHKIKYFLCVAVTLQMVITLLSNGPIARLAGLPSVNYSADLLPTMAIDYYYMRSEVGYGGAILITSWFIFLFIVALINGLILYTFHLVNKRKSRLNVEKNNKELTVNQLKVRKVLTIIGIILITVLMAVALKLMAYPFLQTVNDSLKPIDELYAHPQKRWVQNLTFEYYKDIFKGNFMYSFKSHPFWYFVLTTLGSFAISVLIMGAVLISSSMGLAHLNDKLRPKFFYPLVLSFIFSPFLILSFKPQEFYDWHNNIHPIIFQSMTLGLSICLAYLVNRRSTLTSQSKKEFYRRYLTGIFMIALLGSLETTFHFFHPNLYSLIPVGTPYSSLISVGITASHSVIALIIPFLVIGVSVPLLLRHLDQKQSI